MWLRQFHALRARISHTLEQTACFTELLLEAAAMFVLNDSEWTDSHENQACTGSIYARSCVLTPVEVSINAGVSIITGRVQYFMASLALARYNDQCRYALECKTTRTAIFGYGHRDIRAFVSMVPIPYKGNGEENIQNTSTKK